MKTIFSLLLILVVSMIGNTISAQEITGDWYGTLSVQGMNMRLVFHITETETGYSATFDSPDQGATGIPFTSVSLNGKQIILEAKNIGAIYDALVEHDNLKGTWIQGGNKFDLTMSKTEKEQFKPNRPQEPTEPYPYKSEDVHFPNSSAGIELAGTLTLPKEGDAFPVVILISGSGPQDRDESFMTHKPFLVLADYLTKQGIAVLRYDDRGFGESEGNHGIATSLDFATDVDAAVAYLKTRKEINPKMIGLAGHSEGGLIAPIVAAENKDVAYIILLAGPGVNGLEIQKQQVESFAPAMGLTSDIVKEEQDNLQQIADLVRNNELGVKLNQKLTEFFLSKMPDGDTFQGLQKEQFINQKLTELNRPWYKYFIDHEPSTYLKKIDVPILAINGSRDVQVSPENLAFIRKATTHNNKVTITEYEGMNHLFQKCNTCLMSEYAQIDITISSIVLEDISNWIWKTVN